MSKQQMIKREYHWRRSRLQLLGELLIACQQPRIQQDILIIVHLCTKEFNDIIPYAIQNDLLEATFPGGPIVYKSTVKGHVFVSQYWGIKKILEVPHAN